ncbi:Nn.00g032230.m01.CDS01 [Neocucurbitaria sp. VM-36]
MAGMQKAVFVSRIGAPIELGSRNIPAPKEGQVLVKVTATMLLPHDTLARDTGLLISKYLPAILGNNVAGVVESVGKGVNSSTIDDRVLGMSCPSQHGDDPSDQSGLQEYAVLNADAIGKIPDSFSDEQAVTLPLNLVTAWTALFTTSGLNLPSPFSSSTSSLLDSPTSSNSSSSSIVIIGGGTNAGHFAIQLAHLAGIRTILVVASLAHATSKGHLLTMGASHVIDRHAPLAHISQQISAILGPSGATHILDCANTKLDTGLATLLSSSQVARLHCLRHVTAEEFERLKVQRPLCDAGFLGSVSNARLGVEREEFWARVPVWLEEVKVLPAEYRVIGGLETVEEINRALDGCRGLGRREAQSAVRVS